jgi:seryl-tRNA synthetase
VNKWVITGLIILGILIIVGVAYDQGAFDNMTGSGWAMILAAVAAPYMAVKNFLFGNKHLREFKDKYESLQQEEVVHRTDLDKKIKAKEQRIAELDKEIQLLDSKLEVLELKKDKVVKEVKDLSIDDTKREVRDLFGD